MDIIVIHPRGRRVYVGVVAALNVVVLAVCIGFMVQCGSIDLVSASGVVPCVLLLVKFVRSGVVVSEDGLIVRRLIVDRQIDWSQVRSFERRRVAGMRQVKLVLKEGRSIVLPTPGDRFLMRDKDFEEKLDLLMDHQRTAAQSDM
ncbi:hypothetical protein E1293_40610 [Actinomadura darangshiensis]|uniref:Low molecular weight protein antigen 6 PH domain-containing protein n=1 Tax=Actinomadura darangshiensis TaxID=705336 RepID=A0A4R5A3I6_9ACTN|nr:PH domain-containing protein [Actinomadura darangshiensis]TDD65179.1 hypothetical protein E1293_40610 [Actinomadura darangshiensis]